MKLWQSVVLATILSSAAHAQTGRKVGMVISVKGEVRAHHKDDIPSRNLPLHVLDSIAQDDALSIPKGGELVVSMIATGTRYTLHGPLDKLNVPKEGAFTPKPGVIEEKREAGRAGAVASNAFDHGVAGGGTNRGVAKVSTDLTNPALNIDILKEGRPPADFAGVVLYRPFRGTLADWKSAPATLKKEGAKTVLLPQIAIKPGEAYYIYIGAQPPTKLAKDDNDKDITVEDLDSADFLVRRYSNKDLAEVAKLKASKKGTAHLDLYIEYFELGLFDEARTVLEEINKSEPVEKRTQTLKDFENLRVQAQKGMGD